MVDDSFLFQLTNYSSVQIVRITDNRWHVLYKLYRYILLYRYVL